MTLEDAIEARQRGDELIDGLVAGRIGWGTSLEGEPAIINQIITDPRPQHYKGFHSVRGTAVQVDVWARDAAIARRLREALIRALTPSAVVGDESGTVRFQRASITDVRGGPEPQRGQTVQRARTELFRESIDFLFIHDA